MFRWCFFYNVLQPFLKGNLMKGCVSMYQQRQQPWKLILGVVIFLSMIGIGLGLFFFFKPTTESVKELPFADALVTYSETNQKLVVTTADKESTVLGEWELPVYWMQADRYGNGVFVLEKTAANQATVHNLFLTEEVADLTEKYVFHYDFTDETIISLDEDALTLYEPSTRTFTLINTEFFTTQTYTLSKKETPNAWYGTDQYLYYSVGSNLRVYSWADSKVVKTIRFEDEIVALFEKEQSLYVLNSFGKSSNYTTIFKLDPKTLSITDLGKIELTEMSLYPVSYVSESVFAKGIDARSKNEVIAWFNPIADLNTSELLGTDILSQSFVFTAHDYLYTISEAGDVSVYAKHSTRPVYTLEGEASKVYPLWITTRLEELPADETSE